MGMSPSGSLRFAYDPSQLYHALDSDGGGELTLEEIDPAMEELFDAWIGKIWVTAWFKDAFRWTPC